MAPTLLLETIHSLSKRNDDDEIGGVPKWALVILIMLAAGVVVICLYGILRHFTPEKPVEKAVSPEQADYMREVRERSMNGLMAELVPRRGQQQFRSSNQR